MEKNPDSSENNEGRRSSTFDAKRQEQQGAKPKQFKTDERKNALSDGTKNKKVTIKVNIQHSSSSNDKGALIQHEKKLQPSESSTSLNIRKSIINYENKLKPSIWNKKVYNKPAPFSDVPAPVFVGPLGLMLDKIAKADEIVEQNANQNEPASNRVRSDTPFEDLIGQLKRLSAELDSAHGKVDLGKPNVQKPAEDLPSSLKAQEGSDVVKVASQSTEGKLNFAEDRDRKNTLHQSSEQSMVVTKKIANSNNDGACSGPSPVMASTSKLAQLPHGNRNKRTVGDPFERLMKISEKSEGSSESEEAFEESDFEVVSYPDHPGPDTARSFQADGDYSLNEEELEILADASKDSTDSAYAGPRNQ